MASAAAGSIAHIEARIGQIEAQIDTLTTGGRTASALGVNGTPAASATTTTPPSSAGSSFAALLRQASDRPSVGGGGGSAADAEAAFARTLLGPSSTRSHTPTRAAALPDPSGWLAPAAVVPGPSLGAKAEGVGGVARWEDIIQKHATRHNVAPELVRAVMTQESGGDPRAVSSAGAMGLMQLMPATARGAGVRDPFDPDENVRAGVALLRANLDRYDGNVSLALAAYNAGVGNVAKYGGVPPFRETQNYVAKITARLSNSGDAE